MTIIDDGCGIGDMTWHDDRAPSRSRKPLRLAYDSLQLARRLAVVSTAAA